MKSRSAKRNATDDSPAGQIEALREKVEVLRRSRRISDAAATAMLEEIDRLVESAAEQE